MQTLKQWLADKGMFAEKLYVHKGITSADGSAKLTLWPSQASTVKADIKAPVPLKINDWVTVYQNGDRENHGQLHGGGRWASAPSPDTRCSLVPIVCECGATKAGGQHSHYCPLFDAKDRY